MVIFIAADFHWLTVEVLTEGGGKGSTSLSNIASAIHSSATELIFEQKVDIFVRAQLEFLFYMLTSIFAYRFSVRLTAHFYAHLS